MIYMMSKCAYTVKSLEKASDKKDKKRLKNI